MITEIITIRPGSRTIFLKSIQNPVSFSLILHILIDLPVTFHKKIKSSGYGSQPSSLKFSSKQKQKAQLQSTGPTFQVTRDFHSQPLPMTIPDELNILKE
jgi:hypothetical protein